MPSRPSLGGPQNSPASMACRRSSRAMDADPMTSGGPSKDRTPPKSDREEGSPSWTLPHHTRRFGGDPPRSRGAFPEHSGRSPGERTETDEGLTGLTTANP